MTAWRNECVVELIKPPDESGLKVGTMICSVRVTHKPTGLMAGCGYERSQLKNREIAYAMIEWGLVSVKFPMRAE
jgi:peptide chain release factor 2